MNLNEPNTAEKIEAIDAEWIKSMMSDFKIKNPHQLSILSGVRYESLTLWLSGKRTISSEGQKTLYWYFRFLDAERELKRNV